MHLTTNRLSLAIGLTLPFSLALATLPVHAGDMASHAATSNTAADTPAPEGAGQQTTDSDSGNDQDDAKKLDAVVVTGSLIRRVDRETASPVITIDRDDITNSGKPTLGDVVQQMPNIAGNAVNTYNNGNGGGVASPSTEAGAGATRVSLRGLGTGRTLMLVNGQRMLNGDVNMLPQSMIKRIDVLAEGASTTYGSDAIGGVVNFVLRDHFDGVEIGLNDGISDHGDGQRYGVNITAGKDSDRYNIVGGIDYNRYLDVARPRRDFAKLISLADGQIVPGGSSSNPSGYIQLPPGLSSQFGGCSHATLGGGDGSSLGDYRCYDALTDTYDYSSSNFIQTAQERTDGFFHASVDLTDDMTAFVDAFYNHTVSSGVDAAAPVGTGDGLVIRADNPINPFGVTFSPDPIPGDPDSGYTFQTRLTGTGDRTHSYKTDSGQLMAGLRGHFGQSSWDWNVTLNYGHTARTQTNHNELIIPKIQEAIDNGANIFDQASQEASDALSPGVISPKYSLYRSLKSISFTSSGELWDMAGGTVQASVGANYRERWMNYTVYDEVILDPESATCGILQEGCGSPGRGSDNIKEVFGELLIPLLSDVPGAYTLNLDLGVRTSNYSSTPGSTTNKKVALEWRPVADLLLRGTVSEVFRAPNLNQLHDGRSLVQPTVNDPCVGLSASALAEHAAACQHVPVNWTGNDIDQVNTYYSGSAVVGATLKPEHGKSIDFGLVYAPRWLEGFNTSVDFWHIYLKDTLTAIGGSTVLNTCFANNNSPFCDFIHRKDDTSRTPGQVFYLDTPVVNLGNLSTAGVDFTVNYDIPHFNLGSVDPGDFALGLNTSYVDSYNSNPAPGVPGSTSTNYAGTFTSQFGNVSRFRGVMKLNWKRHNWDAQWRLRYINGVTIPHADRDTDASLKMDDIFYNAVQVGYTVPSIHTRFDVGIDNVFNKKPPKAYQNGEFNTDPNTYDVMLRYYWARATISF